MINPETQEPMKDLSAETQDIGMIDREIIEKAEEIYEKQESYEDLNTLIIELFTEGVASQIEGEVDRNTIPRDRFQEDKFEYQKWQLEICKYIHDQTESKSFSEVKSSILRQGLDRVSGKE